MAAKHWDENTVINNIFYLHSTGVDLCCSHIQEEHKALYFGALRCFGSWKDAVIQAGFDYDKIRKRKGWTRNKIIAAIRRLYSEGEDLSSGRMHRKHGGLVLAARRRFKSWGNAVKASGIDYNAVRRYQRWTKKRTVEEIKTAYATGEDLSWRKCITGERRRLLYAAVQKSRFGSWDKALEAAGIDYENLRKYRSWDKDKVVGQIRKLRREGVQLNAKHMQTYYKPIYYAALRRFDSWADALEAAGTRQLNAAIGDVPDEHQAPAPPKGRRAASSR